MGASYSHTPPHIEISGPRNKVLVPPGTSFTVNPPYAHFLRSSRRQRYPRVPNYYQVRSPYSDDSIPRRTPRRRRRLVSEDTKSEVSMSFSADSPAGRGTRRVSRGGMVGMSRGLGIGGDKRPRMGSGVPPPGAYMDGGGARARSALNLHTGYEFTGRGPPPRLGTRGVTTSMPPKMSPPLAAGINLGELRYAAAPPGYDTSAGENPYAFAPGRATTPAFHHSTQNRAIPLPQQSRRPLHPSDLNEVPMSAYAAGPAPPLRAHTEPPPASARLNTRQPSHKTVGPSGQEWIKGDPFLDACTCTTNCNCRKGQRVLYRSEAQDGKGINGWGEIRYVLKDDLGKDCGDHSGCHRREDDKERKEGGKKRGKEKKRQSESDENLDFQKKMKDMKKEMQAMQDSIAGMKLKDRNDGFEMPSRSPYGNIPMPTNGTYAPRMSTMDPRMLARFGDDPYGMGDGFDKSSLGMGGGRRRRGPRGPPGLMPGDIEFDDMLSEPFSIEDMEEQISMSRRPPPRMMRGRKRSIPSDMMRGPPRRRGRVVFRGLVPDVDLHSFGPGYPLMRSRGMGGRRTKFRGRQQPPDLVEDDSIRMDMPMRPKMRYRKRYEHMKDDGDDSSWEDEDEGGDDFEVRHNPVGTRVGGYPHMARYHSSRARVKRQQPTLEEVEDDDDE